MFCCCVRFFNQFVCTFKTNRMDAAREQETRQIVNLCTAHTYYYMHKIKHSSYLQKLTVPVIVANAQIDRTSLCRGSLELAALLLGQPIKIKNKNIMDHYAAADKICKSLETSHNISVRC